MKIVFLGTPEFAVASLKALLEAGNKIVGVVTAPDRPAGRGRKLTASAVKEFATEKGLKILQPENLKHPDFISELKKIGADLQIVVAFRMLPEVVWNMPPLGTYNLHGSLLPRYRGAAPINRAVMNGDRETGVTTFKLQHKIDSGNILLQDKVKIGPETTAGELHDVLMEKGAQLLVRTVNVIANYRSEGKEPEFISQREDEVTHAPKIFREDCEIVWERPVTHVHNQVRGLSPAPGAFTYILSGQGAAIQLKILRSKVGSESRDASPGALLTDGISFLRIKCADGWLDVLELQLEGKKRMGTRELLRGYHFGADTRAGKQPDGAG